MNGKRPPLCPRCKLDVDKPGHCITCKRFLQSGSTSKALPYLLCCVCGIAFPKGKPHGKCLEKYRRRAEAGLLPAEYWGRRNYKTAVKKGRVIT